MIGLTGQGTAGGLPNNNQPILHAALHQTTRAKQAAQQRQQPLRGGGKNWGNHRFNRGAEWLRGNKHDDDKDNRILRLWQERWEFEKIGPNGNLILEAKLMKKYKGSKFFDMDPPPW